MKPLSIAMADRAHAALTYVLDRVEHDDAKTIITGLIDQHGASLKCTSGTHVLRCAGIQTSNTANTAKLLLDGWRRNAVAQLSVFI